MTRTVKWLIGGLSVSLMLNLLIVGFVAGRMAYGPHHPGGPGFSLDRMAARLAPESREVVKTVIKKHHDEISSAVRTMHKARQAVREAMTADELDSASANIAFANLRHASTAMQTAIQGAMIEVASRLPADERAKLVRRGEHMMRRMLMPRTRHGKKAGDPAAASNAP